MARYNKTTFSNSHAAAAEAFTTDATYADDTLLLNVLSPDPASAAIYSIGTTLGSFTLVGNINVPTDLLAASTIGTTYYSDLGAAISITTNDQIAYDMLPISRQIDALGAGQRLTDKFFYAIEMGNGTVSWSSVQLTILGLPANIGIDQGAGFVTEQYDWQSPPANPTDALADDGAITAFAASGDLTTITVSPAAGNRGALGINPTATFDSDIGALAYHFTYLVGERAIYDTGKGFGEKAFTDSWTVTTANGTTTTFTEDVYGNIHAPVLSASAANSAVIIGTSVGLYISATDHDDNAFLSYKITGVPTGAGLRDYAGVLSADASGSYNLSEGQLAGLTLTPDPTFTGNINLTVAAINTEGTATAQTDAHIRVDVSQPDHAPVIMACPENVTTATLSTVSGHVIVGDYFVANEAHGLAYNGSTFITIDAPGAVGHTTVQGVNAAGVMVGVSSDSSGRNNKGFSYSDGVFAPINVPTSMGNQTVPLGINDSGQIVGQFTDSSGTWHGFLDTDGVFTALDFPSATVTNTWLLINDKGRLLGMYDDASGRHGFTATPSGCDYTWQSFDAPGYAGLTQFMGQNNQGEIVGSIAEPGPPGFSYKDGTYTPFAPPFSYYNIGAYGVDDQGEVVGTYYTSAYHGYLYDGTSFVTIDDPLGSRGTVFNGIHSDASTGYGQFAFSDADTMDTHTVSGNLLSANLSSGSIPNALQTALQAALTPELVLDSTGTGTGEVDWKFTFPEAFKSTLNDGDKLTASYGVTITDNHGASATQSVDLTILGASNWFNISTT